MTSSVCAMSAFGSSKLVSSPLSCPDTLFDSVSYVSLTFSRQKNGVRGETTGHAASGHPILCPVRLLIRRIRSLRAQGRTCRLPSTPFAPLPTPPGRTSPLPRSPHFFAPPPLPLHTLASSPPRLTARSTRSGGAMALLCGGVDADRIRLLGRWRSDAIFRVPAHPSPSLMAGLAPAMLPAAATSTLPLPSSSHAPCRSRPYHPAVAPPVLPLWVHPGGPRIRWIRKLLAGARAEPEYSTTLPPPASDYCISPLHLYISNLLARAHTNTSGSESGLSPAVSSRKGEVRGPSTSHHCRQRQAYTGRQSQCTRI
jgi:hypothetical protein